MSDSNAYKDAGVDIEAGETLVSRIKPHVKATHRSGVMGGLGGFGAVFDPKAAGYTDPLLVSATDGVGTKVKIAVDTGRHETVGIDLVAMCVNDLVVQGAEPLYFLDYYASGKLDVDTGEEIIKGIATGCEQAGCALIGGETAEMPGVYADKDYDLAGFTVGAVERDHLIDGSMVGAGDVILGLASNGLHSNGFSLVRKLVRDTQGFDYSGRPPYDTPYETLGESLLAPTRIYVKPVLDILEKFRGDVHAMAHITGGGLNENIPRALPEGLAAELDCSAWPMLPVFKWLKEIGHLSNTDIASSLNTGIGFAMIVKADRAEEISRALDMQGETVYRIGEVKETKGPDVKYLNQDEAWNI